MILKLKEPIIYGSETITQLEVRKPKAKDVRKMPASPSVGDVLDLAAKLCSQAPSVIDELDMVDMQALLEIVGNFMEPGQETGKQV